MGRCLHLKDELDTFDGGDGGFRHGSGDTAGQEILRETVRVFGCLGFSHFCGCLVKVGKEKFGKKICLIELSGTDVRVTSGAERKNDDLPDSADSARALRAPHDLACDVTIDYGSTRTVSCSRVHNLSDKNFSRKNFPKILPPDAHVSRDDGRRRRHRRRRKLFSAVRRLFNFQFDFLFLGYVAALPPRCFAGRIQNEPQRRSRDTASARKAHVRDVLVPSSTNVLKLMRIISIDLQSRL